MTTATDTGNRPGLVLGSGSPRRLELLEQIGIVPDRVVAADIDETPLSGEDPRGYCRRITKAKSDAIRIEPGEVLLTADTTVAVGRRILGKPADAAEARAFLTLLSGRRHRVITAMTLRTGSRVTTRDQITTVRMKRLTEDEIRRYLDSGEWQGKAGGYGIQGLASTFIPWISGSYSGVMGLPLAEAGTLLGSVGILGTGAQ